MVEHEFMEAAAAGTSISAPLSNYPRHSHSIIFVSFQFGREM